MFRLNFKAGIATASKNSAENYYMIGLGTTSTTIRTICFSKDRSSSGNTRTQTHRITAYTPSVGDVCYNSCKAVKITSELIVLEVQDSVIAVDIREVKIPKRFTRYCKEIFGNLLSIEGQI